MTVPPDVRPARTGPARTGPARRRPTPRSAPPPKSRERGALRNPPAIVITGVVIRPLATKPRLRSGKIRPAI
jgi:hypothetical protein